MLDNYLAPDASIEQKQRILAVQAALELIKATLSDVNDGTGIAYQFESAEKHIALMADAIQSAIVVK